MQEKSVEQLTAEIKARYGISGNGGGPRRFSIVLLRPSHYDGEGYVVQWARCAAPSETLETLRLLAEDCLSRGLLGREVQTALRTLDETTDWVRPERLAKKLHGGQGLVLLAGVGASQFTRAMDIALPLRVAGVHIGMQGPFVNANLEAQGAATPGLREVMNLGVALLAGDPSLPQMEALLRDAWHGRLQTLYPGETRSEQEAEAPPAAMMPRPRRMADRVLKLLPSDCVFATVVPVNGRSADAVEQEIRLRLRQSGARFLLACPRISDHPEWQGLFDRLIDLREREKQDIQCTLQVDSVCHRLPHFVEKATRAGVRAVFVRLSGGWDSISDWRSLLLEWKRAGTMVFAGITVGSQGESTEDVVRHVRMLKRELPIDALVPACAPVPGRTIWQEFCLPAWKEFYTLEHIETVLRRSVAMGADAENLLSILLRFHFSTREKIDPMLSGFRRHRHRRDRQSSMEREDPLTFFSNETIASPSRAITLVRLYRRYLRFVKRLETEPGARSYTDPALFLPDLPAAR